MNPFPSIADRVRTESTVAVLREPALTLLSRIQDLNPSDQVRAQFLVACVIAEAIGLNPHCGPACKRDPVSGVIGV